MKANKGKWLTTLIAMRELGVCRLSERCREIHACGIQDIKKQWQTVKTRYGKCRVMGYRL
jgi:hypothetical protein